MDGVIRIDADGKFINMNKELSTFFKTQTETSDLIIDILSYYESHLRTALNKKEAVAELGVRKEIMRHDYERFEATLNAIVQDGDFKIYLDNPDNTRENHQAQTFQILMASQPNMNNRGQDLVYICLNSLSSVRCLES